MRKHSLCSRKMAGWNEVRHTPVLCLNGYSYLKTFWPSVSPTIPLFLTHTPIPNSKRNPVKYTGWEKFVIFDWTCRLSRKWHEMAHGYYGTLIGSHRWRIGTCRFQWHWVTFWPGFQGHNIFRSQISQKRCVLGTKLLKNTNRKPYQVHRMVPLSMTSIDLWPRFQSHNTFFFTWISQKQHEIEP